MLFAEFPYYIALYRVYRRSRKAGSDRIWIIDQPKTLYVDFVQELVKGGGWDEESIPWSLKRVLHAWTSLRKAKKLRTTCRLGINHGTRCFYFDRNLSLPCSDIVNLDRIRPGSQQGQYDWMNCIISCSTHNQSRGDRPISEFLEDEWCKVALQRMETRRLANGEVAQ